MDYIQVTKDNLDLEHICCAISNNDDIQVASKKAWLRERLDDGLVFLKSAQRGKCFIEYLPVESAWAPIEAPGYLYIDCFWVSGALKGHGYANELLAACIADGKAQGKRGLCVLSSAKKRPFLSDPGFLRYKGFALADTTDIGVELLALPLDESAPAPRFKACARHPRIEDAGYVLYYTHQCPYPAKYVPVIEALARENGVPFRSVHITSKEQAQALPCPCTSYALFHDGAFVTNEILSDKKFLAMIQANQ